MANALSGADEQRVDQVAGLERVADERAQRVVRRRRRRRVAGKGHHQIVSQRGLLAE